jgi:hypothetical protein
MWSTLLEWTLSAREMGLRHERPRRAEHGLDTDLLTPPGGVPPDHEIGHVRVVLLAHPLSRNSPP